MQITEKVIRETPSGQRVFFCDQCFRVRSEKELAVVLESHKDGSLHPVCRSCYR